MFDNPYNYFFAIWFNWQNIYEVMSLSKDVTDGMKLGDMFSDISILNGSTEVGMNSESGLFEFYIIPNSLKNGDYKPHSTIYDQQTRRFSSGAFIYNNVLENEENDREIYCTFNFHHDRPSKVCFSIAYSNSLVTEKEIRFYFDSKHLNDPSAYKNWGDKVDVLAILIETSDSFSEPLEKVIILKDGVLTIKKHIQSQYENFFTPEF